MKESSQKKQELDMMKNLKILNEMTKEYTKSLNEQKPKRPIIKPQHKTTKYNFDDTILRKLVGDIDLSKGSESKILLDTQRELERLYKRTDKKSSDKVLSIKLENLINERKIRPPLNDDERDTYGTFDIEAIIEHYNTQMKSPSQGRALIRYQRQFPTKEPSITPTWDNMISMGYIYDPLPGNKGPGGKLNENGIFIKKEKLAKRYLDALRFERDQHEITKLQKYYEHLMGDSGPQFMKEYNSTKAKRSSPIVTLPISKLKNLRLSPKKTSSPKSSSSSSSSSRRSSSSMEIDNPDDYTFYDKTLERLVKRGIVRPPMYEREYHLYDSMDINSIIEYYNIQMKNPSSGQGIIRYQKQVSMIPMRKFDINWNAMVKEGYVYDPNPEDQGLGGRLNENGLFITKQALERKYNLYPNKRNEVYHVSLVKKIEKEKTRKLEKLKRKQLTKTKQEREKNLEKGKLERQRIQLRRQEYQEILKKRM